LGQLQTKKIYVHQLETGMYVSGLDRPWLETPFYLQGFMIRNAGDVQSSLFTATMSMWTTSAVSPTWI